MKRVNLLMIKGAVASKLRFKFQKLRTGWNELIPCRNGIKKLISVSRNPNANYGLSIHISGK